MIYLASPYTHPDPAVREERYKTVCRVAAKLMAKGLFVYSPIAMTHGICVYGTQGGQNFEFAHWAEFDHKMIDICEEVWIVMMDGWEQSNGIKHELAYALSKGKPVKYI